MYLSCYVALGLVSLTTAFIIIITMHVFSMNTAGGDSSNIGSIARCIVFGVPACPPVPLMSGHLQCTDTFSWSRGCPFMTGTTVYIFTIRKRQKENVFPLLIIIIR